MKARKIMKLIDKIASPQLAEKWDNCGFQLGSYKKEVKNILLALDVTPKVINEAIEKDIDMIITHHPLLFKSLKKIKSDTVRGKMIYDLIKNDIVVFSAHTNLDADIGGVNDVLAQTIGLSKLKVLKKTYQEYLYKIVVFVPKSHYKKVRHAIMDSGAGWIGKYSNCSFNTEGKGTFMPRKGSKPFIGESKKLETVQEIKIETIVKKKDLNKVIKNMLDTHPYEEVAYDIYKLENKYLEKGIGRIGELDKVIKLEEFAKRVKRNLHCNNIRVYGDLDKEVKKVAVCGGSGASYIKDAYLEGSDVYITGDVRSYEAQQAIELGLPIIDANHYETERVILPQIKKYIKEKVNYNEINIYISKLDNNAPFATL